MSSSLRTETFPRFLPGVPLLDGIRLKHGPAPLLGRFFLLADQAARDRGVILRLHSEMASFAEIYPDVEPGRGVPVHPIFDPAYSDLSPDNAFWISGHDETGQVVATQAGRFADMTGSTVERELTSMRLFFADPEKHLAAGTRCIVDCPPAREITGRVLFTGGAVYNKKVRGLGLSTVMPRISRALAYTNWNTNDTIGLVAPILFVKNVHRSYGFTKHAPSIAIRGSVRGDEDFELVWMARDELLDDLARYVADGAGNNVRNTEATETNSLPPRLQGSISRS